MAFSYNLRASTDSGLHPKASLLPFGYHSCANFGCDPRHCWFCLDLQISKAKRTVSSTVSMAASETKAQVVRRTESSQPAFWQIPL